MAHLKTKLTDALDATELTKDQYLEEHSWDEATEQCEKIVNDYFPEEKYCLKTPPSRIIETYSEETDRFCLILDRDKDSHPPRYLRYLKQDCEKK